MTHLKQATDRAIRLAASAGKDMAVVHCGAGEYTVKSATIFNYGNHRAVRRIVSPRRAAASPKTRRLTARLGRRTDTMTAQHTPGPWTYLRADGSINNSHREVGRFHTGRQDHGNDARPLLADARLIAAAPCLLLALTATVSAFERGCQNVRPEHKQQARDAMKAAIRDARAAIAKARGQ